MATSTIPYNMPLKRTTINLAPSVISSTGQVWQTSGKGRVYLNPGITVSGATQIVAVSNGNWSSMNDNVVLTPYVYRSNVVSWYISKGTASQLDSAFIQHAEVLYY